MRIGVAYYPEHWPEERWPVDARMIKEAGIDVVRVAEFAWSRLEPKRGQFDMGWLAEAMGVLSAAGLQVILGTPSAAPPQWLFVRHPGMAPEDEDGRKWYPGSRRHVCLNNRPYRRYVRRIVREMARTFGQRPEVVAWQIDNELGCSPYHACYCDDCEQAFREWLKRRYGIIDRLNKLWGTAFWSQHVNDWHEIPAPRRTAAGPHPSLVLDYKRFTSATVRDFVAEQRDLIRQYSEGADKPITTNGIGLALDQLDQFSLAGSQDVATIDNYPVDAGSLDWNALQLDLTRSARRAPFWVLEQQAGPTLIRGSHSRPSPGQLRLWSYQAAARGAELIAYFRWRTCPYGQEMHWYGMLDADGRAGWRFEELTGAIAELKDKAPLWQDRKPDARAAMVLDYHAHWALQANSMGAQLDYLAQFKALYGLLRRRGLAVDLLPPGADPAGYELLVAPMPVIARDETAVNWGRFVARGGVLLVTAPAGCRTEQNTTPMAVPPGPLGGVLGVEAPEHDVLGSGVEGSLVMDGETLAVRAFCAAVELRGAEAVAVYGGPPYEGRPAATCRADGEGRAYFLAAVTVPEAYERVLDLAMRDAGIEPHPWSSEAVEVIPMTADGDGAGATFVLNHSPDAVQLPVSEGRTLKDLLTGDEHTGSLSLPGCGVALIEG